MLADPGDPFNDDEFQHLVVLSDSHHRAVDDPREARALPAGSWGSRGCLPAAERVEVPKRMCRPDRLGLDRPRRCFPQYPGEWWTVLDPLEAWVADLRC